MLANGELYAMMSDYDQSSVWHSAMKFTTMLYGEMAKTSDEISDAMFSIEVEGINSLNANAFPVDPDIESGGTCNAYAINFKNFVSRNPPTTNYDSVDSKYYVKLRSLVNSFGLLSDSGGDDLIIEVYSDYLK